MKKMLDKLATTLERDLRVAAETESDIRAREIIKVLIQYITKVDVAAGAIATDITYSAHVL